ncbi:hypothetical protein [Calothrix sp. UHCC 0171]|uniref:hypothetical protein n=1 Tax=Calothrix sp. UHCC 0171 TaxID=3110245 RepID=UPI002B1FC1ED|nr:hypothetical protein [Calothrix sp. UHCC 0171]MEA5574433.1 hypothetical protein [Calothrix sp. UHCC 0171]
MKNPENKIQIDRVHQYGFSDRNWQGEQVKITLEAGQARKIIAKLDNQILGILNQKSADFLNQQLAVKGRTIQGLTLTRSNVSYFFIEEEISLVFCKNSSLVISEFCNFLK